MIGLELVKHEVLAHLLGAPEHHMQPFYIEMVLSKDMSLPRSIIKEALKDLIDDGELCFSHRDPFDYLEIAPAEPHRAARPMRVVVDDNGDRWICDADVDDNSDLPNQGCWSCGSLAFTRSD